MTLYDSVMTCILLTYVSSNYKPNNMKYLLAIAVVLCLMGCATNSHTQSTCQYPNDTITVFTANGIEYID